MLKYLKNSRDDQNPPAIISWTVKLEVILAVKGKYWTDLTMKF